MDFYDIVRQVLELPYPRLSPTGHPEALNAGKPLRVNPTLS
jgi:hypothetical protein